MIFASRKRRRRERLRATLFPPEWKAIITRNIPIFSRLPAYDKAELLGDVQVFLAEK
ncbi:MAG: zinc-dependent peptidase, partial [Chthoniobacterales bacterium]